MRGSDIGWITDDVITGCGCSTNAAIIFKNASSLVACYWLSSFKRSNFSLKKVSEDSVYSEEVYSLSLAVVGTYFLFVSDAPSEDLEEEP